MKRLVCFLLSSLLIIQSLSVFAAGSYSFSYDDGVIDLSFDAAQAKTAVCTLKNESFKTLEFRIDLSNGSQIGLPIRQIPIDTYEVSIKFLGLLGNEVGTAGPELLEVGCESPVGSLDDDGAPGPNDPSSSRAIMQPVAKVYANASLVGDPIAELKRLDIVSIISKSGNVAHISGFIQSGEGHIENSGPVDATYVDDRGYRYEGYISTEAFQYGNENISYNTENKQREVVELAYSRQGIRGVYSQARRYSEYYLDCSALATWCWYQVGIDMSNGGTGGTSCTGLIGWADSQGDSVNVWTAEESHVESDAQIAAYKEALHAMCPCEITRGGCTSDTCDGTCWSYDVVGEDWEWGEPDENGDRDKEWYDVYDWVNHCVCGGAESCSCQIDPEPLVFGSNKYGPLGEQSLVTYTTSVDEAVYVSLQPGDLIFFNHMETSKPENEYDGHPYTEFIDEPFKYRVKETANAGYDHVGVFVGLKDERTALIIESSSPSTDPNKNTKISQIPLGGDRALSIGRIIRPCGGVEHAQEETQGGI